MATRKNTLKDLLSVGNTNYDESRNDYHLDDTPPVSDISMSSPEHSLPPSPEFQSQFKDDSDEESLGITKGMLDTTRMALCMFMFVVVTLNPFGLALSKIGGASREYGEKHEKRFLLGCKYLQNGKRWICSLKIKFI